MRILAIDPATEHIGWAVLDYRDGIELLKAYDEFHAKGVNRLERLLQVGEEIRRLARLWVPDHVGIESGFVGRGPKGNPKAGLAIAESRGVCILAGGELGAKVHMISPGEAKKSATGKGKADKHLVCLMVTTRFSLSEKPPFDASDAIAVGLSLIGKEHERWVLRKADRESS